MGRYVCIRRQILHIFKYIVLPHTFNRFVYKRDYIRYFKDKTICDSIKAPAGWKWDNDNPGLLSLRYVMSDETSEEILDDFYKGKSTYEDWKEQPLKDLAEWAIQIPARTDNVTELYKGLREFERNGVVDNHIY